MQERTSSYSGTSGSLYWALPCSSSSQLMPTIASPRFSLTSAITCANKAQLLDLQLQQQRKRTLASEKWVTACTTALARAAGLPLLKIPEPTNTPSQLQQTVINRDYEAFAIVGNSTLP